MLHRSQHGFLKTVYKWSYPLCLQLPFPLRSMSPPSPPAWMHNEYWQILVGGSHLPGIQPCLLGLVSPDSESSGNSQDGITLTQALMNYKLIRFLDNYSKISNSSDISCWEQKACLAVSWATASLKLPFEAKVYKFQTEFCTYKIWLISLHHKEWFGAYVFWILVAGLYCSSVATSIVEYCCCWEQQVYNLWEHKNRK